MKTLSVSPPDPSSSAGTKVASAPAQPNSSAPKVSRQPRIQPVPAKGERQRCSVCAGSMFGQYAA
jgi:hypothetical protein